MEKISGRIIVNIYFDDKSGFQISKIETNTHTHTVSGYFPRLSNNVDYEFEGEFFDHPKYGRQFKVSSIKRIEATGKESLVNYLSSELFTGIGPKTALKIYDALGDDCIEKIINNKQALEGIITKSKIELLYFELINNRTIEKTIQTLTSYGISMKMAMKLYQKYSVSAIDIVNTNPYQLIDDVEGFGFKKADELARSIGFALDNPIRIQAAIIYVLRLITRNYGYTYVEIEQLLETASDFASLDKELIHKELLEIKGRIIIEDHYVFLKELYNAEVDLVNKLALLNANSKKEYPEALVMDLLDDIQNEQGIKFTPTQKNAIMNAITNPITIITGGPGTGKTTIINGILRLYAYLENINLEVPQNKIGLMAPTGRAAKRMFEATKVLAFTIHHHLGYSYEGDFEFDKTNLLSYDLIIVDEASMIDVILANQLIGALKNNCKVIFVGDLDQLPSVGPGQILKDLIDSKIFNTSQLIEIHRQAQDSNIISLASYVRKGELTWDLFDYHDDLSFYRCSSRDISQRIKELVESLIENGYNPLTDIQILIPMYKGVCGIDEINLMVQNLVNKNSGIIYGNKEFKVSDKVMQLVNSPDLGIMNGDIGIITKIINGDDVFLEIDFDGNKVKISKKDLENITHAYAISIHKSQGSEYPIVILPITKMHNVMLKRKLLYTAITRAKSKLFVIGDLEAFKYGINVLDEGRQTTLLSRLTQDKRVLINIEGCPFTYLGETGMENITPYDFLDE